jgi:hypothetical protein
MVLYSDYKLLFHFVLVKLHRELIIGQRRGNCESHINTCCRGMDGVSPLLILLIKVVSLMFTLCFKGITLGRLTIFVMKVITLVFTHS